MSVADSPRRLGRTGIEIPPIGLGCMGMSWAYSGSTDEASSLGVIRAALDQGAWMLDTADVYGPFENEELVGRAIAGRRDETVLATKGGFVASSLADLRRDGRPDHIRAACEGSLRRLGTDRIDLYYLHRVDPEVPIEESVGAMAELVDEGKVRALGLSEVSVADLDRAADVHPISAVQMELSLWTREPLADVVPWCESHGATVVAYSPLGRGFLTGSIRSAADIGDDDFRSSLPRFQAETFAANLALADRVKEIGAAIGATAGQVALAWILAQGEHVVAIPGTKRLRYLEENIAAGSLRLSDADLAALDELPDVAGGRYEAGAGLTETEPR